MKPGGQAPKIGEIILNNAMRTNDPLAILSWSISQAGLTYGYKVFFLSDSWVWFTISPSLSPNRYIADGIYT